MSFFEQKLGRRTFGSRTWIGLAVLTTTLATTTHPAVGQDTATSSHRRRYSDEQPLKLDRDQTILGTNQRPRPIEFVPGTVPDPVLPGDTKLTDSPEDHLDSTPAIHEDLPPLWERLEAEQAHKSLSLKHAIGERMEYTQSNVDSLVHAARVSEANRAQEDHIFFGILGFLLAMVLAGFWYIFFPRSSHYSQLRELALRHEKQQAEATHARLALETKAHELEIELFQERQRVASEIERQHDSARVDRQEAAELLERILKTALDSASKERDRAADRQAQNHIFGHHQS